MEEKRKLFLTVEFQLINLEKMMELETHQWKRTLQLVDKNLMRNIMLHSLTVFPHKLDPAVGASCYHAPRTT